MPAPNSFGEQLLFRQILGSAAPSLDTGAAPLLPQGFDVLEVWMLLRTDEASTISRCDVWLNNDSGTNYDDAYIANATGSAGAGTNFALSGLNPQVAGSSSAANRFDVVRLTIPFYALTTAFKQVEGTESHVGTTTADTWAATWALCWRSTNAVNRISVQPHTAGKNLVAGSGLLVFAR